MPALQNLDVEWVSLVDRAAVRDPANTTEPQRFLVWKREGDTPPKGGGAMTEEQMRAAVEKAEKERDESKAALTKAETEKADLVKRVEALEKAAKPADAKPEPIDKSDLPKAVVEALEKAEEAEKVAKAERETMAKRVDDAEKLAKAEREERLTRDFIAKAETFTALPIKSAEFGPVLKSLSEGVTADTFTALETVLKAADEQIAKGELFKEHGRSGETRADGSVLAEVTRKAEEIRKSDPKLTATAAFDAALTADRSLQERYLAEVR